MDWQWKRWGGLWLGLGLVLSLALGSVVHAQGPVAITDVTQPQVSPYPALSRQPVGLVGKAALPTDSRYPGPTSAQLLTPGSENNNKPIPFKDHQPLQGFSAARLNPDGSYFVMVDNGFGAKNNSADALLSVYRLRPDFKTAQGGSGEVQVLGAMVLHDPERKVGFPVTADLAAYPQDPGAHPFPGPLRTIAVDPMIKAKRLLTGMDFDLESFRRAADGSFWFGDEFGPFLVHTDASGKLLEAPVSIPIPAPLQRYGRGAEVFRSPQNPAFFRLANDAERLKVANQPRSKGLEGMAISADGSKLYPLLEGPMIEDPDQSRLVITEFDLRRKRFTGRYFFYKLEAPFSNPAPNRNKIGDMAAVNEREFLVIEADDGQGSTAGFKKIFKIDLGQVDAQGFVRKQEVVDLLNIANPNNLDSDALTGSFGTGNPFKFPFQTVEVVQVIDRNTILVGNDNNYPTTSGNGRRKEDTDHNEFILVRLAQPLRLTTKQ